MPDKQASFDTVDLPRIALTSADTHLKTEDFLARNGHFGAKKSQIILLKQEQVPVLADIEGHFVLQEEQARILKSALYSACIQETCEGTHFSELGLDAAGRQRRFDEAARARRRAPAALCLGDHPPATGAGLQVALFFPGTHGFLFMAFFFMALLFPATNGVIFPKMAQINMFSRTLFTLLFFTLCFFHPFFFTPFFSTLFFFQDTNALSFKPMVATLGLSTMHDLDMNTMAVPRKPGDACGALMRLRDAAGHRCAIDRPL